MNNIKFFNLQEAFNYLFPCLICKHSMGFGSLSGAPDSRLEYEFDNNGRGDFYPHLIYRVVDGGCEDKFTIGIYGNDIDRETRRTIQDDYVTGDNSFHYSRPTLSSHPQTSGFKYLALRGSCTDCYKYDWVVQLVVGLEPLKLMEVVFNSETVIFQAEAGERWELKNIYTTRKTIYTHFAPPRLGTIVHEAKQDLPLLPLNREDPAKTLKRVKNLLIFT